MGERTYKFRRTVDGGAVSLTPAQFYAAGNKRTRGGAYAYEPLTRVPGFTNGLDGSAATMIEPGDFHSVASQQYNESYHTSFALGSADVDARWDIARKDEIERAKRKTAREHYSGAPLVANRALNIVTFGGSNALLKRSMGEEAGEALLRARQESPGTDFFGTVLGTALLAMMPAAGFGAFSKIGGKIAGGADAAAAHNVKNLFGISAAMGQRAKTALAARGHGNIVQGLGVALASGATAEIPLSMAIASADLVDSNEQWNWETFVADTGVMVAAGMGIATLTGIPVIAGRHILGGTLRKGGELTAKGKEFFNAATYAFEAAGGGLGYRVTRGIRSKGTAAAFVGGSVADSVNRSLFRSAGRKMRQGMAGRTTAAAGRWIKNEVPQNFVVHEKTLRKLLTDFDLTKNLSRREFSRTARELAYNLDDVGMAQMVREIADNVDNVYTAQRMMSDAPVAVDGIESLVHEIRHRVPKGVQFKKGTVNELQTGLIEVSRDMDVWNRDLTSAKFGLGVSGRKVGSLPISRPQAPGFALAKEMRDTVLPTNNRRALQKTLEFRSRLEAEAGISAPRLRRILDDRIEKALGGQTNLVEQLRALDNIQWNVSKAKALAEELSDVSKVKSRAKVEKIAEQFGAIERDFDFLHPSYIGKGSKDAYKVPAEVWRRQDIREAAQQVTAVNELRSNLLMKDTWFSPDVESPVITLNAGKLGREELLETQINVSMATKVGIKDAFRFLRNHGGPMRQSAAFYGVFHYRQMMDQDERASAFEANSQALLATANGPEASIQHIGYAARKLASVDQGMATGYSMVVNRAQQYLLQHLPRNDEGTRLSAAEQESWLERLGALENPISLIYASDDGSVMPEGVDAVRSVYPAMYTEMMLDTMDFVHNEGHNLTETQLVGLDMFLGGALGIVDSSTPMQPPMAQTPLQSQTMGSFGPQRMQQLQAIMQTPNQKLGGL